MRKRRKDLSHDELVRKELIREYLSKTPNNSLDFSALIKEMMGQMLESALDGELEEQLGYSKYDTASTIIEETFTGTTANRPRWIKLKKAQGVQLGHGKKLITKKSIERKKSRRCLRDIWKI
ncbi:MULTISPECIES: hypothetical protein [Psychrilyobacter]|uniref:Uncharacterized protein n=1 Tax=Psychrilyobacter piezotolerans TaxID=2293438 RepID=A0ABX9KID0_9FUSO|nr:MULTISPECIES: hypothetical protein [Psychrilyobacter]MCS5420310.1 hypothetical protein [Psychrilyobacter sp. S5]NDI77336.1 hypothetical protein [Psychrilyobacter piezotolerans]RDE63384.1 hypothetical protein DV867_05805 [Psychrilyobacter sp. S5]REI41926.1 hypothetical protein DYH56_05805 [Psychrilyobacter piezotolerans]